MSARIVFVGLSGGVDSSVAAWLLKEQGFDVTGVHLRLWESPDPKAVEEKALKLKAVTEILGIPMRILDWRENFRRDVVGHYLEALKRGLTPNPCVTCNRLFKWGQLLAYARSEGADQVASGHYARLARQPDGSVILRMAKDRSKDQSYFLSALPQNVFQGMNLPLAELSKHEVREIANRLGLAEGLSQESEDLCFLEGSDQAAFLREHAKNLLVSGPIYDSAGVLLGQHQGLPLYTIGQRKGIRIAAAKPYYVLQKDIRQNALIVGFVEELAFNRVETRGTNWVSGFAPDLEKSYQFKMRSTSKLLQGNCLLDEKGDIIAVLDDAARNITPGQRLVVYDGDACLGGAEIIKATYHNKETE